MNQADAHDDMDAEAVNLPALRDEADLVAPEVPTKVLDVYRADPYRGAGTLQLTPEEGVKLAEEFPADCVDILPSGEAYIGHPYLAERLNDVFGAGQWFLLPQGEPFKGAEGKDLLCQRYTLVARGAAVAQAIGEMEYQPSNDRMTYGDVMEGIYSNALKRCCKRIGIGLQVWKRRHNDQFTREHCIKVFRKGKDGKTRAEWRRKDAPRFWNETGPCPDQDPTGEEKPIQQPQRKAQPAKPTPAQEAEAADRAELARQLSEDGPDWSHPGWRQGPVEAYTAKPAKNDSTRHAIKFAGKWASTFSETHGAALRAAKDSGRALWICFETSGDYINVMDVYDGDR